MVRAVDQGAIERAMGDDQRAIGGAIDCARSDVFCERWIRERRMVKAMDQRAKGGAMYGASGGSGSCRRSDAWCK
jgi:hypothetical protein